MAFCLLRHPVFLAWLPYAIWGTIKCNGRRGLCPTEIATAHVGWEDPARWIVVAFHHIDSLLSYRWSVWAMYTPLQYGSYKWKMYIYMTPLEFFVCPKFSAIFYFLSNITSSGKDHICLKSFSLWNCIVRFSSQVLYHQRCHAEGSTTAKDRKASGRTMLPWRCQFGDHAGAEVL